MQKWFGCFELIMGIAILLGLFTWLFNLVSVRMLACSH